ncbi:DUF1097 domain-containing protein [Shewanella cyperi]|uniref:DUF1097 domain-containing protein n=1 Tax=Shewanella cyperi TaxID=2814292 RepID=A0A975AJ10_9GAMM|nr:DUF1097 domain-containing protein [Shewanella cyperi]QSX28812.1 DUF1097 domain-containing protein [Shewanella cyperi]
MWNRMPAAIAAGLLAAVWAAFADHFGLLTVAGFLGCSAFFAQGRLDAKGWLYCNLTLISGLFWAWLILKGGGAMPTPWLGYLLTGVATSAMCLQACNRALSFIPAAFIGCCGLFVAGGEPVVALLPLMLGAALGLAMAKLTSAIEQLLQYLGIEGLKA